MSYEEVDVEEVVRAVMARLGGNSRRAPGGRRPRSTPGELTLLGRLVTEE